MASGGLFVNQGGDAFEDMYCEVAEQKFTAYLRIRADIPASISNKKDLALDFPLKIGFCDAKASRLSMSALSRLRRAGNKDFPPSPCFFNVTVFSADEGESVHKFAAVNEEDRNMFINAIKDIGKASEVMARGEKKDMSPSKSSRKKKADKLGTPMGKGNRDAVIDEDEIVARTPTKKSILKNSGGEDKDGKEKDGGNKKTVTPGPRATKHVSMPGEKLPTPPEKSTKKAGKGDTEKLKNTFDLLDLEDDDDEDKKSKKAEDRRVLGVKVVNILRFFQVLAGFPFAIVIGTIVQPPPSLYWIKRPWFIYVTNLLVVAAVPLLLVQFVLKEYTISWVQRLAVGSFLLVFYGIPIGYHYVKKLTVMITTPEIVDGAFSFKPSSRVRMSFSNGLAFLNMFFEWWQLVLMALPGGLLTSYNSLGMKDYPPYLDFQYYFWACVALSYLGGLIMLIYPVLRGKTLYKFTKHPLPWNITYALGNFLFLPIVTILFMGLWCNYEDEDNPTFLQDKNVACYSDDHLVYARCGLVTVGFLIIMYVILPPGSYKETIPESLDVIFVPNYLSLHAYLKVVFAAVYVFFYTWDMVRIPVLCFLSILMLLLNMAMKPCSIKYVNVIKDTIHVHVCLCCIQSLNYLTFDSIYDIADSDTIRYLIISTLGSNLFFASLGMGAYYYFAWRHTETAAAANLVELDNTEKSVGHGSRIIEPLISITIDNNKEDIAIARKYIPRLVGFLHHPAPRVQFQIIWALANLSLYDEEARVKIHEEGGTQMLLENFDKFSFGVQLEALAALANLSLSKTVSEAMVRRFDCVPFLMQHIASKNLKHSLFSLICLCNLSMRDMFREQIRYSYGIESIITCLMSHDYQKRKFGALALSNMALSSSADIQNVFETRGIVDRIMKMAKRNEVETQREVVALVRNLACHAKLRPVLLDNGIMGTLEHFRGSVHEDVAKWTDEISILMQREITMGSFADSKMGGGASASKLRSKSAALEMEVKESDREYLRKMQPLDARVEWSTWGSKLDTIFQPLTEIPPRIETKLECEAKKNEAILINMASCLDAAILIRWRDNMSFVITREPKRGEISDPEEEEGGDSIRDDLLYTPAHNFVGEDSLTYVVRFGEKLSQPCVLTIIVGGSDKTSEDDMESGTAEDSDDEDDESKSDSPRKTRRSTFARLLGDDSLKVSRDTTATSAGSANGGFMSWFGKGRDNKTSTEDDYPDEEYGAVDDDEKD